MEVALPPADVLVSVQMATDVSAARRAAAIMAEEAGIRRELAGAVSIVATEAASNLLKHAGGGEIVLRNLSSGANGEGGDSAPGVEVIALDKGPGLGNASRCFEDGYSTAGSPGNGMGAIRRLTSFFAWFSHPGSGTAIVCRVGGSDQPPADIGGINIPYPGEQVSGRFVGGATIPGFYPHPGRGRAGSWDTRP